MQEIAMRNLQTKITGRAGDVRNIENALIFYVTRGGLLYPSSDVVHIVTANYIIYCKQTGKNC